MVSLDTKNWNGEGEIGEIGVVGVVEVVGEVGVIGVVGEVVLEINEKKSPRTMNKILIVFYEILSQPKRNESFRCIVAEIAS